MGKCRTCEEECEDIEDSEDDEECCLCANPSECCQTCYDRWQKILNDPVMWPIWNAD